ncbi:MAG: metal ABC transporter permease [Synergistales bacterium]|nr:metal ABC transporter permease [Synergistales bacterium]
MLEALQFEFMQNALWAALLASILCGIIGTVIVVKRMVILAGGVAHAAYGGVGLAVFLGISPQLGAMGFSMIMALLMSWVIWSDESRSDTVIGIIWALGMALGVVFTDITPGYGVDLMSYLFGSILTVTRADLYIMAAVAAISTLAVVLYYRPLLAFVYDEEFAWTRGIPVKTVHLLLVVLLSLSVVLIIRIVGLILVIALVSIPPHMAEGWSRSLGGMMVIAALLSAVFTLGGLWMAYSFNLTSGATIILFAATAYFANRLVTAALRRRS